MGNLCCCECFDKKEDDDDSEFSLVPEKGKYKGDRDILRRRHGKGVYFYQNGDIYDGFWERDKKHGFGEYRFIDGRIITGYFVNDRYVGKAISQDDTQDPSLFRTGSARPLTSSDLLSHDDFQREKIGNSGKMQKAKFAAGKKIGKLKKVMGIGSGLIQSSNSHSPDHPSWETNLKKGMDGPSHGQSSQDALVSSSNRVTYASFDGQKSQCESETMSSEEYQEQLRAQEQKREDHRIWLQKHKVLREAMRKKYNLPERPESGQAATTV